MKRKYEAIKTEPVNLFVRHPFKHKTYCFQLALSETCGSLKHLIIRTLQLTEGCYIAPESMWMTCACQILQDNRSLYSFGIQSHANIQSFLRA